MGRFSSDKMADTLPELPPVDQFATPNSVELMDDFYLISQDTTMADKPAARTEQFKSFIRNALPSSPIMTKKSTFYATSLTASGQATMGGGVTGSSSTLPAPGVGLGTVMTERSATMGRAVTQTSAGGISGSGQTGVSGSSQTAVPGSSQVAVSGSSQTAVSGSSLVSGSNQTVVSGSSQGGVSGSGSSRTESDATAEKPMRSDAVESTKNILSDISASSSPYLLLSQEDYLEHTAAIVQCRFSPSGQTVATLDVDGVLKTWTLQPSPATVASTMSKSVLTSLEWINKSDRLLLLGSKVGSIRIFDIREKKNVREVNTDTTCPRIIGFASHPQGTSFACSAVGRLRGSTPAGNAARIGKLSIFDFKTMKVEQNLALSPGPIAINSLTYNHNGQLLLTSAADGYIRLYDLKTGSCISQWVAHSGDVYTTLFSADETSCYSIGSDGKLIQWSINKTGRKMAELPIHSEACGPFITLGVGGQRQVHTPRGRLFALDAEGGHILTCSPKGGLIYKLDHDLERILYLEGHRSPVVCVDWSSAVDYRTCLTASMDGRIQVSTLLTQ